MNCPICGAKNEADARFCAECGASLEEQFEAKTPSSESYDTDQTILSGSTMATTQPLESSQPVDKMAQTEYMGNQPPVDIKTEPSPPGPEAYYDYEAASEPAPHPPLPTNGDKGNRSLLIVVVVLLLLCCCCTATAIIGWSLWTYGDQLVEELSLIPVYSYLL